MPYSIFDVGCSMFNVHIFLELRQFLDIGLRSESIAIKPPTEIIKAGPFGLGYLF